MNNPQNQTMEALLRVLPSTSATSLQNRVQKLSALFAFLIFCLIAWGAYSGTLGTWTLIILALPMVLFVAISWFVWKFGKDYVAGLIVYPHGIGNYYPMVGDGHKKEEILSFDEIQRLEMEETIEVHRMGRRIRKMNVYRIRILKRNSTTQDILSELIDLDPQQVIQFRKLGNLLVENGLLSDEQVDRSKMPV